MEKEKIFHITWVTFNSRVSERMKLYKVKTKKQGVFLDNEQEFIISKIIGQIVKEISLKVYAYNICNDHIHMLIQCNEEDLNLVIRRLKGKSTKLFKDYYKIKDKINLWGQKFSKTYIENKKQFFNVIEYINNNRIKHGLKENKLLEKINFCIKVKK